MNDQPTNDRPILSMVMTGRDDDYMPDFRYRLATTVNFIANGLEKIGELEQVEILVTDWGSDPPLADTIDLTPGGQRICRYVYVSPDQVGQIQGGQDGFHVTLAANAGLRRANGQFVMASAADILFTAPALDSMLRLLRGQQPISIDIHRTYFLCRRFHIPWQYVRRQPSIDQWERYLLLHAGEYDKEYFSVFGTSAGAGAILMSRHIWHEVTGLDEQLGGWGWNDVDLGIRVGQHYPWIDVSAVGVSCFHMEHPPNEGRRATAVRPENINPFTYHTIPQANSKDWGLRNIDLPFQKPHVNHIDNASSESVQGRRFNARNICELFSGCLEEDVEECIQTSNSIAEAYGVSSSDRDALHFLAWYSRFRFPRRFIEFGVAGGMLGQLVSAICPSVEVYAVDNWHERTSGNDPIPWVADIRHGAKHRGYLRFINGDPDTALRRLRDSFIGPCSFDLAFVRVTPYYDTETILRELLDHLPQDGALVLNADTAELFNKFWDHASSEVSDCSCLLSDDERTGMMIRVENGGALAGERLHRLPPFPTVHPEQNALEGTEDEQVSSDNTNEQCNSSPRAMSTLQRILSVKKNLRRLSNLIRKAG